MHVVIQSECIIRTNAKNIFCFAVVLVFIKTFFSPPAWENSENFVPEEDLKQFEGTIAGQLDWPCSQYVK